MDKNVPNTRAGKIKLSTSSRIFYAICYVFVAVVAVICLIPFIILVSSSFTSENYIRFHGYSLIPKEFTLEAYQIIFRSPMTVLRAYGVSIFITIVGVLLGLILTTMTAYVLSRKDFKYRNKFSFFFYFTTLFNGGMVCTYIFYIQYLHLKDSLWLLILPLCVSTMNVIILRTYIVNSIPAELMEAAKIDGAGEYRTFFQITLPLLKPSLAAVGFMMATAYWNDWQNALLYITSDKKKPLQLLLVNIQKSIEFLLNNTNVPAAARAAMGGNIPQYSATMATVLVVIGPIMVVYPFFQKYFIKGLTVGSVKG